jgi:Tol biopolymer transport system component
MSSPELVPSARHDERVLASFDSNLVAHDANQRIDQFVYDTCTGRTHLVSRIEGGEDANDDVAPFSGCAISADGRTVVYVSSATNLVDGDTNDVPDVFAVDRESGDVTRISVADDGTEANGESGFPSVGASATNIVFESVATNLVADDENRFNDVFLHRPADGTTRLVGRMLDPIGTRRTGGGGGEGFRADTFFKPALSPDANYVAFTSEATTLVAGDHNRASDAFVVSVRE